MSWSIKKIGTRAEVRAAVDADTQLPSTVKAAILNHLGLEPGAPNGVRVEGYGHHNAGDGSCNSSIGKLEVEAIELVLPTAQPEAEQPATPTAQPEAEQPATPTAAPSE